MYLPFSERSLLAFFEWSLIPHARLDGHLCLESHVRLIAGEKPQTSASSTRDWNRSFERGPGILSNECPPSEGRKLDATVAFAVSDLSKDRLGDRAASRLQSSGVLLENL